MKLVIVNADTRTFYNMVFNIHPDVLYIGYELTTSTSLEETLQ